jgi:hypothetical protein
MPVDIHQDYGIFARIHNVQENNPDARSMRSTRSMRGGFIFRSRGPSLKVHHSQYLARLSRVIHGLSGFPTVTPWHSNVPGLWSVALLDIGAK